MHPAGWGAEDTRGDVAVVGHQRDIVAPIVIDEKPAARTTGCVRETLEPGSSLAWVNPPKQDARFPERREIEPLVGNGKEMLTCIAFDKTAFAQVHTSFEQRSARIDRIEGSDKPACDHMTRIGEN